VKKYEWDMQELWDSIMRPSLSIIGIDKQVQAKGIGNIFNKALTKNFPNIKKGRPTQVQEAFRTSNRQNQNRTFSLHIVVKLLSIEDKERILKLQWRSAMSPIR
jgi:hypothetical protein